MRRSSALAGGLAAATLANAAPLATLVGPVGRRLAPDLIGIGHPGHTALTFDDGPDPTSTPAVLDRLAGLGLRATFFLLGSMVQRSPNLAARLVHDGHEIAVHGYAHDSNLIRSPRQIRDDLRRAIGCIEDATGVHPHWFRPPYGHLTLAAYDASRAEHLQPVLWSAWGRDWRAKASPASILQDLRRGHLDGGTVLLHDSDCTSAPQSWRATVEVLPALHEHLHAEGWQAGTLAEHWRPSRTALPTWTERPHTS